MRSYTLQILIADDNQLVRRGIALLLSQEKDWSVCGEAATSEDVLKRAEELRPEVILLDVSMPGIDGLETTRLLKQRLPDTKVLIISQHDPHHLRPLALEAGAVGCIDKARLATDLLPTIRKIGSPVQADQRRSRNASKNGSNGVPDVNRAAPSRGSSW